MIGEGRSSQSQTSGEGTGSPPPPSGLGLATSGPAGSPGQNSGQAGGGSLTDLPSHGTIIERPFDLVVTCGPRGATIHPGGYRITNKALEAGDGLLLQQLKGLVAANRGNKPNERLDPRVRFLVQPGGEATYRSAKVQVLLSGLGWPITFQVAGPDPVASLSSESW